MPERLELRRADGSAFAVTVHRAPDATAPAALVVPAMGMRAAYYTPLLAVLAAAGITAAATELRGHEAVAPVIPRRGRDFGYAELVDDLAAALDALRTARPAAPPVLVGHSLGAHLALGLLARDRPPVAGLALVGAGTTHWRHWSAWHLLRTQGAAALARGLGHFPGPTVGFGGREAPGVIADWARLARTGRLTFGRPPTDHTAALAELTTPVLAMRVADDALGPRRALDGLLALLPRATVTTAMLTAGVEGLDHFRWARRPDRAVAVLAPWLRDRRSISDR